jgi:hypothetical protein
MLQASGTMHISYENKYRLVPFTTDPAEMQYAILVSSWVRPLTLSYLVSLWSTRSTFLRSLAPGYSDTP